MDRRADKRFPVKFPVEFVVLGRESERHQGYVRDISQGGLRLTCTAVLRPGNFLRVEIEDTVLFGEVKYSHPWVGGSIAGIYVERVLLGTSELSRQVGLASER